MDFNAIRKTFQREIKSKVFGKSSYGKQWKVSDDEWYLKIHKSNYLLHEDFKNYLKSKKDIKTILEIGCGAGVYPIKFKELFQNISYTGLDISQDAIDYCKRNSSFNFICGDFIKMEMNEKFDLIYSHAVVDHVYGIDAFITKIVQSTKKYAYINSYRGYHTELSKHKMKWNDDEGCYYNDLSVSQVKDVLLKSGLEQSEFIIRSQESGQTEESLKNQLVIEINKKS